MTVREAIEELLADYAEAIDDGALERWPGFFTEDGEYQIITRESHDAGLPIGILYCDSRGMMEDRVQALRTANIYEPHAYRHLLGRPRIERHSDGFAVRSNFCVYPHRAGWRHGHVRHRAVSRSRVRVEGRMATRLRFKVDGASVLDRGAWTYCWCCRL